MISTLSRATLAVALFVLLGGLCLPSAQAQQAQDARTRQNLLLYFENDIFGGTDQHYTNGVKLTWLSSDLSKYADDERLPFWAQDAISYIPFIHEQGLIRNVGLSIGQNLYTPSDRDARELLKDDRPYAAWLYFSTALHSKNREKLDSFEITAGMVGPSALGEQTQNNIHDLFNIGRANGWEHQLRDEPGLILSWQRTLRFWSERMDRGFGVDFLPRFGVSAGNVLTQANAGAEFRIGWNLPSDFGTSLINPGGGVGSPVDDNDPRLRDAIGFHLFFGAEGRAVARNIFLDGNTWRDSHHVDKKYFVGDLVGGMALLYGDFKITYSQVYRTEEYDGQDGGQTFGSLSLNYVF